MVLGLILMVLGALAIVAAVGTAEGTVQVLGVDLQALTVFLIGVGAGVAILWGFALTRWGTKRTLRQRRDAKRLEELARRERREDGGPPPDVAG